MPSSERWRRLWPAFVGASLVLALMLYLILRETKAPGDSPATPETGPDTPPAPLAPSLPETPTPTPIVVPAVTEEPPPPLSEDDGDDPPAGGE